MGKIPPALRTAPFPVSNLLKKSPSVAVGSGTPTQPPPRDRHFPRKVSKKKSAPSTARDPKPPTVPFNIPSHSDAKALADSITAESAAAFYLKYHNSHLQSFSAVSSLDDSISHLREMIKNNPTFSPDRSTYHVLLIQSCKFPDSTLNNVRKVLCLMAAAGFPPDKVTTDVAVRSLCNAGCLDLALELFKEFCLKHSPPDSYTYNFLLKHLCKDRPVSVVNNFIKEMRDCFGIKPDLVAYTILIDNVCNKKNLREATRLLELLSEDGFKPDRYVYNIIMKGYCMLSQGSEVLWVYKKMKEGGVEPDLVTYNTLIFGLSKSGRVKEARKYLNVMAEMGHFPDEVTYTSLMNGMCREGNALGALQLLEEMEAQGCSPNSCTYNTLLHGLCKAKLLGRAMELYGVMKSGDMKLETGTYGTLLRALCRNGKVAEAYEVFDYAVESKSLKDFAAYSTLESTLKWLKKAKEQGLAV
ncbi:pentatricopeptide repeat-containing protein At2g17670 [Diospyros lotus]|uniref:pentatricopeptide repeat-containing protein At2g17670 n=1 Tax=Diospyros lotus TaxID=55363 RepID=UPI00224FD8CD|nr:pentatricopeptide repeat-containing protein At2g17670 [Diospyros lotus]XP_052197424.1 pentatricopeptide repeat-containing protein At2g17670 [Diospyros lotus]XP_052197425.1 pentatricopeptide repeat-containing protein At2g17670 [Diospyros lotus]